MPSLRKRGAGWRVEVCKNGVRDSATFDTKAEAFAWGINREEEIAQGEPALANNHTVREALEKYRDTVSPTKRGARWEQVRINGLAFTFLDDKQLRQLTATDIAAWRDHRLKTVQGSSVLRERNILRSVLEVARREWLWMDHNPFDGVRWPPQKRARVRRISEDEQSRLLLAMGYEHGALPVTQTQRVAVAFLLAIETAMRAGELCGLTAECININGRFADLEMTKNGDRRHVPLSSRAMELLQLLMQLEPDPQRPTLLRMTPVQLDALFRKAKKAACIEDLHFHDTRHEALTRLAKKLSVLDLARMAGHRDVKSLMAYYNPTATEIASQLG